MLNKLLLLLFAFGIVTGLSAQKIDTEHFEGLNIRNIGPAGMSGRVTTIDVVTANPNIMYVGTASGGIWKSETGGLNWTPIFDEQPVQSIGAVALDQNNPSVIWAGTGEGNPRNSQSSGKGIYKSIDGGKNWELMGLEKTITIHRIIIHRDNPDIIFVAAMGSAWGPNPERGVYKTTDGGKTWKKILYINDKTGAADLVVDPTNPNKLIVAMWEYGREPWFFNSGGEGSGMHITFDGGKTWKKRTDKDGLPKGQLGRMGLSISHADPKVVYALIESKKTALYKSTDGGFKWRKAGDKNVGNRPFYYADIYADPQDVNTLYSIHSTITKTLDGGKSFNTFAGWSIHPDHHAFWIHPNDPNFIIDGNDGGLNITHDGGVTWRFVKNLPVAQFYHINYDMDKPYNVYGGMQDNGSWVGPGYAWQWSGIRNSQWQEVLFGDGFDVMPHPADSKRGYAMYQGGNVSTYHLETGATENIQPVHPDGLPLRFNWNAAMAQDPFSDCGIYFGSQHVHHSTDCGKSWTILSPDLTTNDTTKQQQAKSGGLTIDATRAENFTTITVIAPSPVDKNVIWVGTDDGNLQLTQDGGKTWVNQITRLKGVPTGSWIPQIEVSKKNAGEAYVIVNNYRRNDWKPYAYKTTDFGKTWVRIADENKVSGHCHSIVQDPVASNLLFLGTEYGLYFSIDAGTNWNKWGKGFPSVPTVDLKIHPREHDLIIGTFGRAAWILDDMRPLRELALKGKQILDVPFKMFDIPDAYLVSTQRPAGARFGASGEFHGRNKSLTAPLTFWFMKEKKAEEGDKKGGKKGGEKESKPKKEKKGSKSVKMKIQVFNSKGDTIRTFTRKLEIDTGFYRFSWNLRRKGVHYPSRNAPNPDRGEPGGPSVLPGTYKLVATYGKHKDSTTVNVLPDPRVNILREDRVAQSEIQDRFMRTVTVATKAFDRLKAAKKTIGLVNSQLVNVEDTLKKKITKSGKAISDSLNQFMEIYMLPADFKGYDHVTLKLNGVLSDASSRINSSAGKPGENAMNSLRTAEKEVKETVAKINRFFEDDWKKYREEVEKLKYSLFKDFEPIKMKE
jgi:photosystem II stability/assembly factor-like uncharacterized protein